MLESFQNPEETQSDWLEVTTVGELEQTFFELQPQTSSAEDLSFDSRYEMLLQVGEGAMGQVFLAQDKDLLRKVAYKRLHSQVKISPEVLARFVREIQITAQLEHPNVVPVYNLEKTPAGWAYAMKLVFGKTLKEYFQEARTAYKSDLDLPEAYSIVAMLDIFLKICEAMDFAHERGVVHRDLKPSNIMIGRYGEVYVMDWGIARVMSAADPQQKTVELSESEQDTEAFFEATQIGKILGTPRYLSPEQAAAKNNQLDGRSDLLTLGLILQELVTLKPAYHAKSLTDLLKRVLTVDRLPIEAFDPNRPVARELIAIITKATALKPEQRYARVGDLAADIRRYLRGQAVYAQPDSFLQARLRWMRQHLLLSATVLMGILITLAVMTIGTFWQQKQTQNARFHKEQQLRELQTQSARQARMINFKLLEINGQLESFSSTAGVLLATSSRLKPQKIYQALDFALPDQVPADLSYVPSYAKLISWDYPVLLAATDAPIISLQTQLQGLNQLRAYLSQDLLAEARNQPQSAAIAWVNIALDNGLGLSYPGKAGYPLDTDFRTEHWYQKARTAEQPVWTRPHLDPQGQGLVLTVAQTITDLNGQARGVAAFDLRFQYLIDRLMHVDLPGLKESYLLNQHGQIMLRSSDRDRMYGMRFGQTDQQGSLDTPLFDQAQVVQQILAAESGYLSYQRNGEQLLLAFYPLNALGWYYAVEVSQDLLFAAG